MSDKIKNPAKSPVFVKEKKDPQAFDFIHALKVIRDGGKVGKLDWPDKWYASIYKEENILSLTEPDGKKHSWILSMEDINGKDYVKVF